MFIIIKTNEILCKSFPQENFYKLKSIYFKHF